MTVDTNSYRYLPRTFKENYCIDNPLYIIYYAPRLNSEQQRLLPESSICAPKYNRLSQGINGNSGTSPYGHLTTSQVTAPLWSPVKKKIHSAKNRTLPISPSNMATFAQSHGLQ